MNRESRNVHEILVKNLRRTDQQGDIGTDRRKY
jgi:hypothetical protein